MQKESILNHPNQICGQLRMKLLDMYFKANAGHIGSSLSCIDILIAVMHLHKNETDAFILSKGHAAAALYATLNSLGHITDEEIGTFYNSNGTKLPAHPAAGQFKEIPFATGSLGHGLPIGTGIAHASKLAADGAYAYVLMSDGETNEGTTWEAMHYAIQNQLDNLIVLVDKNGLQGFGTTSEVLGQTATTAKWSAIGFEAVEVDGHDVVALSKTIEQLKSQKNGLPKVIIANTIKGKGVSYMENKLEWHYLPMTPEQYATAQQDVTERYLTTTTNA